MSLESSLVTILEKEKGQYYCDDCLVEQIRLREGVNVQRLYISASAWILSKSTHFLRDIGTCSACSVSKFVTRAQ